MIKPVLVEIIVDAADEAAVMEIAVGLEETGLVLDHNYLPVLLQERTRCRRGRRVFGIRGEIEAERVPELKSAPNVLYVWDQALAVLDGVWDIWVSDADNEPAGAYTAWEDNEGIWRYGLPPSEP